MDQATVITYAGGYIAAVVGAFLLYLPLLIGIVLLLVLAGTVTLVAVLVKALALGLYRFLARELRRLAGRVHGGGRPGGGELAPH